MGAGDKGSFKDDVPGHLKGVQASAEKNADDS